MRWQIFVVKVLIKVSRVPISINHFSLKSTLTFVNDSTKKRTEGDTLLHHLDYLVLQCDCLVHSQKESVTLMNELGKIRSYCNIFFKSESLLYVNLHNPFPLTLVCLPPTSKPVVTR